MRHCEHVKSNGHFCGSPALRGRNYCFFHLTHIGRQLRAEQHAAHPNQNPLALPLLEDAASIQLALMQVTDALLRGTLDPKRAGLVLYALQTASLNLRHMANESADSANDPICNQYDAFEQDYELDDNTALRVSEAVSAQNVAAEILSSETLSGEAPAAEVTDLQPQAGLAGADKAAAIHAEDRPVDAPSLSIPHMLTAKQYHQAKNAVFGYEALHDITRENPQGRALTPQHPASSQKIFLGPRKPPTRVEAGLQQPAVVAAEEVAG